MVALRILRAGPTEEIAAHPATLRIVRRLLRASRDAPEAAPVTAATIGQLWPTCPLVGDNALPRGEIHCRSRLS